MATPLEQAPLDLGVDVTIISITKAMACHSDLLLGSAATRSPELHARLTRWRSLSGAIPGPFEAFLAHRSLPTLDVDFHRFEPTEGVRELIRDAIRGTADDGNVVIVAHAASFALEGRDDVLSVRYPGLPSDPGHLVAARQMQRFWPVVSFTLRDADTANRFLDAAELVVEATSFGGVHTMAERRERWGGDGVPEGLIRLSAGLEDPDDMREDVTRELDAVR